MDTKISVLFKVLTFSYARCIGKKQGERFQSVPLFVLVNSCLF
jgi:hypothetical protein